MPKRTIESALSASLRAEQQAVEKRLLGLSERAAKADAVLQRQAPPDDEPLRDQRREQTRGVFSASREARYPQDRPDEEEERQAESGRVMRANFSMPVADYALMNRLRERCSRQGVILTRSEVLRAGLHALDQLPATQLLAVIRSLERLKPGPVKGRMRSARTRNHSAE